MWLILLACLPFLILLLHLACTALQTACVRAAAEPGGSGREAVSVRSSGCTRCAGSSCGPRWCSASWCSCTSPPPRSGSTPCSSRCGSTPSEPPAGVRPASAGPGPDVVAPVRLGPGPGGLRERRPRTPGRAASFLVADLGRAASWLRTLAVALPLGGLTVGLYLLLQAAARPTRSWAASLFLEWGPDNTYGAYVAGVLGPDRHRPAAHRRPGPPAGSHHPGGTPPAARPDQGAAVPGPGGHPGVTAGADLMAGGSPLRTAACPRG